jgi:hypothetical protein
MLPQSQADTAEPVHGRGEVLRCSKRLVISTGNHALRGAVNWGAEKNRIVTCAELETDKSDPHKTRKTRLCFYPLLSDVKSDSSVSKYSFQDDWLVTLPGLVFSEVEHGY